MPLTTKVPLVDLAQADDLAQRMLDGMTFNRDTAARFIQQMTVELRMRRNVMEDVDATINAAQGSKR